jgi:hypothetical protein
MAVSRHRYFAAWPHSDAELVEIVGARWDSSLRGDWRFPLAVLAEASRTIEADELHFYFTKDPNRLPEYGPHVVAVLLLEERCKIPWYARDVRAVIRNTRSVPFLAFKPRLNRLNLVLAFEYARDWAIHWRSRWQLPTHRPDWPPIVHSVPRVCTIPLGYHSQEELPQIAMRDRTLDCFFAGDLSTGAGPTSYRYWVSTSKAQARKQLWRVLLRLKKDPEWQIDLGSVTNDTSVQQFDSYSEKMMRSRICLAPRGTMAETYRLYEGLRAGCLVITNRLPDEPYLRGAPVIQVDHWKELPGVLRRYARDLDALEDRRNASLAWWENHCSEFVIGPQVARFLNDCD